MRLRNMSGNAQFFAKFLMARVFAGISISKSSSACIQPRHVYSGLPFDRPSVVVTVDGLLGAWLGKFFLYPIAGDLDFARGYSGLASTLGTANLGKQCGDTPASFRYQRGGWVAQTLLLSISSTKVVDPWKGARNCLQPCPIWWDSTTFLPETRCHRIPSFWNASIAAGGGSGWST
jgi:hypothetical protein